MLDVSEKPDEAEIFTWAKLRKSVFLLYLAALLGFIVKALNHAPIANAWQALALLVLPGIYLLLPLLVFFIFFAFKGFKIEKCKVIAERLAYTYAAFVLLQLISSKPL